MDSRYQQVDLSVTQIPYNTNMLSQRHLVTSLKAFRLFSASARSSLDLAHHVFQKPQAGESNGRPIIFIHGLFGSKQNNRGMSK